MDLNANNTYKIIQNVALEPNVDYLLTAHINRNILLDNQSKFAHLQVTGGVVLPFISHVNDGWKLIKYRVRGDTGLQTLVIASDTDGSFFILYNAKRNCWSGYRLGKHVPRSDAPRTAHQYGAASIEQLFYWH